VALPDCALGGLFFAAAEADGAGEGAVPRAARRGNQGRFWGQGGGGGGGGAGGRNDGYGYFHSARARARGVGWTECVAAAALRAGYRNPLTGVAHSAQVQANYTVAHPKLAWCTRRRRRRGGLGQRWRALGAGGCAEGQAGAAP
jgi:hypothetical protein